MELYGPLVSTFPQIGNPSCQETDVLVRTPNVIAKAEIA